MKYLQVYEGNWLGYHKQPPETKIPYDGFGPVELRQAMGWINKHIKTLEDLYFADTHFFTDNDTRNPKLVLAFKSVVYYIIIDSTQQKIMIQECETVPNVSGHGNNTHWLLPGALHDFKFENLEVNKFFTTILSYTWQKYQLEKHGANVGSMLQNWLTNHFLFPRYDKILRRSVKNRLALEPGFVHPQIKQDYAHLLEGEEMGFFVKESVGTWLQRKINPEAYYENYILSHQAEIAEFSGRIDDHDYLNLDFHFTTPQYTFAMSIIFKKEEGFWTGGGMNVYIASRKLNQEPVYGVLQVQKPMVQEIKITNNKLWQLFFTPQWQLAYPEPQHLINTHKKLAGHFDFLSPEFIEKYAYLMEGEEMGFFIKESKIATTLLRTKIANLVWAKGTPVPKNNLRCLDLTKGELVAFNDHTAYYRNKEDSWLLDNISYHLLEQIYAELRALYPEYEEGVEMGFFVRPGERE